MVIFIFLAGLLGVPSSLLRYELCSSEHFFPRLLGRRAVGTNPETRRIKPGDNGAFWPLFEPLRLTISSFDKMLRSRVCENRRSDVTTLLMFIVSALCDRDSNLGYFIATCLFDGSFGSEFQHRDFDNDSTSKNSGPKLLAVKQFLHTMRSWRNWRNLTCRNASLIFAKPTLKGCSGC